MLPLRAIGLDTGSVRASCPSRPFPFRGKGVGRPTPNPNGSNEHNTGEPGREVAGRMRG